MTPWRCVALALFIALSGCDDPREKGLVPTPSETTSLLSPEPPSLTPPVMQSTSAADQAITRCLKELLQAPPRGMLFFAYLANHCSSAAAYEQALSRAGNVPLPMETITVVRMSCLSAAASLSSAVCRDLGVPASSDAPRLSDSVQEGCITLVTAVFRWLKLIEGDPIMTFDQAADATLAGGTGAGPEADIVGAARNLRGRRPSEGADWGRAVGAFMTSCAAGGFRYP